MACKLSQSWDYSSLHSCYSVLYHGRLTPEGCISQAPMTTDSANGGHLWDFKRWEERKSQDMPPSLLWAGSLAPPDSPLVVPPSARHPLLLCSGPTSSWVLQPLVLQGLLTITHLWAASLSLVGFLSLSLTHLYN